jgi:hypothetical protein
MNLKLRPKVRIILSICILSELRAKILCPNLTPMLSLLSRGKANKLRSQFASISFIIKILVNKIGIGGRAMMLLKWQSLIRIFSQIW